MRNGKIVTQLYFQVIVAILIGILLGHFYPHLALQMKPFGDGFIKLIRLLLPPVVFTTVVTGIANMKNVKEAGRIGIKAILYFEIVTTLAMIIGLVVGNYFQPGAGIDINLQALDSNSIAYYANQSTNFNLTSYLLNIIPDSFMGAFAKGDILPVLFISMLFGVGLLQAGEKARPVLQLIDQFSAILFAIIGFVMRIAPIGAFGAIAYTIGTYGIHSLLILSKLLFGFYLTSFGFVILVLGIIAKLSGFSIFRFLSYIKEELLIVLSTSSSEVVLPRMIDKLEKLGCGRSVVGLVLPAGYTFNLDGMCIYLTMAIVFIAQVFHIPLSLGQQFTIISMLLFMSKGAATITGGGFIILATAISSMHYLPTEGLVLLLGIDRFMSEGRSLTNLIGNGVATIVIAKWEGEFDPVAARQAWGDVKETAATITHQETGLASSKPEIAPALE